MHQRVAVRVEVQLLDAVAGVGIQSGELQPAIGGVGMMQLLHIQRKRPRPVGRNKAPAAAVVGERVGEPVKVAVDDQFGARLVTRGLPGDLRAFLIGKRQRLSS